MPNLLIVESPAKCKKIASYLGAGWRVQATMGHIRALKEDLDAIGFRKTWQPTYESIQSKREAIASLRKAAQGATVFLGSDDDREGEAIAWHTCAVLGLDPATTPRVVFHEITESALRTAVANPRTIDMNKFYAQQARTMLDMLIGFTLSPCLWRAVGFKSGLSAGRCQTPALRIIYDRDREVEAHVAAVSWKLSAETEGGLIWKSAADLAGEEAAAQLLQGLLSSGQRTLTIKDRQERIATHQAPAPFITSSLQQEASNRLGLAPKATMKAAQTLYEAGHITYMRTDNAILSAEAHAAASEQVQNRWGTEYLAAAATATKVKKIVKKKAATSTAVAPEPQAAHEGIRPTHMEVDNADQLEGMGAAEQRLYNLIWKRTIQSVMAPEQRDTVRLTATLSSVAFDTVYDQTRFAGWRIMDVQAETEAADATAFEARNSLQPSAQVSWLSISATETRTSPPSRYTEASLIRELESRGIGRPSTYATLVETVLERGYVEKSKVAATPIQLRALEITPKSKAPKQTTRTEKIGAEKDKIRTTALGRTVIEWLLGEFGDMIEYDFTASMESQLDEVAHGTRLWQSILTDTWSRYADRYDTVMATPKQGSATATATATAAAPIRTAKRVEFGDGYKMIVSKKGPLFVLERLGATTEFAPVPGHLSIQTATRADVEAAFQAKKQAVVGDILGELDEAPVIRKKGPYGFYVDWHGVRLNCAEHDTLEILEPRLRAKATPAADAVDHTVGPYRIKRGPYGLYMFKTPAVGSKAKPLFVSLQEDTAWQTLTPESAEQIYKHASAAKRAPAKRASNKGKSSEIH
jgi:DNA topoisomerase-1